MTLEKFAAPLPAMGLISVNTAPDRPVATQNFTPAAYDAREKAIFERLRVDLRRAIADRDARGVAAVATGSADINQRKLMQPRYAELKIIARKAGALGVQVAHSGTMVGILLPPDLPRDAPLVRRVLTGVQAIGPARGCASTTARR